MGTFLALLLAAAADVAVLDVKVAAGVDPALGIQLLKRHVMAARSPLGRRRSKGRTGAKVFPNPNKGLLKNP